MAMTTYPLNNVYYNAEDAELYNATRTSGVWSGEDFDYSVSGNDNIVTVGEGLAWIRNTKFSGKVVAHKEIENFDFGVSDPSYPRIDVLAIQFNATTNSSILVVKKGNPSTTPEIPERSTAESLYELYLFSVLRPAGSASINESNITDLRDDENYCGYMQNPVTGGFAPSLVEQNKKRNFRFWVGSKSEYDEQKSELKENTFCIIENDTFYVEDKRFKGCYYRNVNGSVEWYNPPMKDGVEYRTIKRFDGKPVYRTYKSVEKLPDTGTLTVSFGSVNDVFDNILELTVMGINEEDKHLPFPIISAKNEVLGYARMGGTRTVYIRTFSDLSSYKGKVILEYTKNKDEV